MSKELEALERIANKPNSYREETPRFTHTYLRDLDTVEKSLKALDIIKHIMNSCFFYYVEEKDTWEIVFNGEVLLWGKGKEEYELLREVLK